DPRRRDRTAGDQAPGYERRPLRRDQMAVQRRRRVGHRPDGVRERRRDELDVTTSTAPPLGVDLTSPATFSDGIPHEVFARMRAEAPVAWSPDGKFPAFWSVTRHADVAAV